MKKFIVVLLCALGALSLTSCRHTSTNDDSSSTTEGTTGKKSSFVIEEVTD